MRNSRLPNTSFLSRLAFPSWVVKGTLAENCAFLAENFSPAFANIFHGEAGKPEFPEFTEVSLLFLESRSCLAYGRDDLPPWLAALPLCFHVHLPVDLPWGPGFPGSGELAGVKAAEICLRLMDKIEFLSVERAVLHLPAFHNPEQYRQSGVLRPEPEALRQFSGFLARWEKAGRGTENLLLENTLAGPLLPFKELIDGADCGLCLDLGHALQGNIHAEQKIDAVPGRVNFLAGFAEKREWYFKRCRMLHLCAAEPGGRHVSLGRLDAEGRDFARKLCRNAPPEATWVVEIFNWADILESLPLLAEWVA